MFSRRQIFPFCRHVSIHEIGIRSKSWRFCRNKFLIPRGMHRFLFELLCSISTFLECLQCSLKRRTESFSIDIYLSSSSTVVSTHDAPKLPPSLPQHPIPSPPIPTRLPRHNRLPLLIHPSLRLPHEIPMQRQQLMAVSPPLIARIPLISVEMIYIHDRESARFVKWEPYIGGFDEDFEVEGFGLRHAPGHEEFADAAAAVGGVGEH